MVQACQISETCDHEQRMSSLANRLANMWREHE